MIFAACRHRLLEHGPLITLIGCYGLIVGFVIPPTGEYPTYDDGVFAATAHDLVTSGTMHISDLPSMSLVTHAAWGAGFLAMLGDSWWTLRVSTMVMAWIGGLAIYSLALQFQRRPGEAAIACGSYIFCPLIFSLNYTFMTDLTGSSLMLVSLACIPAALRSRSLTSWIGLGILGGVTYLARQTAAIPAILLGMVLLMEWAARRRSWREVLAFGLPIAVLVAGHQYWLRQVNGVPSVYGIVAFNPAIFANFKGLVSKLFGIALEAALMCGPLIVCTAGRIVWRQTCWNRHRGIVTMFLLSFVAIVILFGHELRPYRGYELYDAGLGFPPTHEGIYAAFRSRVVSGEVTVFHVAVLIPAAALLALSLAIFGAVSLGFVSHPTDSPNGIAQVVVRLSFVGYGGLLLLMEFVFDRYLILLIVLGLAELCMLRTTAERRSFPAMSWLTLAGTIAVCVVSTQDVLQMRRAYWQTVAELHASGIAVDDLDAGSTYLQHYVYEPAVRSRLRTGETFLAGLRTTPWNGYDTVDAHWKVAYGEFAGWEVHDRVPFETWVRSGEILVLRRQVR